MGRRSGATIGLWTTLAHNPQFFEASVQLCQKFFPNGFYKTTLEQATDIMGFESVVRSELACEILHRKKSKDSGPLGEPHPLRPQSHVPFLFHTLKRCTKLNREGTHSWYLLCILPMTLGKLDKL